MKSKTNIAEKIKLVCQESEITTETINEAIFKVKIKNKSKFIALNRIIVQNPKISAIATIDGEKFPFPINEAHFTTEEFRIHIQKNLLPNEAVFFSVQGFINGLRNAREIEKRNHIYINAEFESFDTKTCHFGKIENYSSQKHIHLDIESFNAKKIIKDSTGTKLPSIAEFWIRKNPEPKDESNIYKKWRKQAFLESQILFCSEIWSHEEGTLLILNGANKHEVLIEAQATEISSSKFNHLTESLNWITEIERESEIRHSLIVTRLAARLKESETKWPTSLLTYVKNCLSDAKNDYRAHVNSKVAETLKSIGEIRKAIAEESSKVVERTHGLSSTLFKDIAISFGAISIRLVTASSTSLKNETLLLILLSILWIISNLYLTASINSRYIISLAKSRVAWNRKVNQKIPTSEFKELSEKPFREAVNHYKKILKKVKSIYLSICAILLYTAFYNEVNLEIYDIYQLIKTIQLSGFEHTLYIK